MNGYAMWTPGNGGTADAAAFARATAQTVEEAVILGDRESVVGLVEKELEAGADPFELVRGRLIPAITEVGSKYERREYFLPQLLRSAETMQTAFARLKPLLEREANAEAQKIIVVATVEGDIHDIGKNIVKVLLENYGFDIGIIGERRIWWSAFLIFLSTQPSAKSFYPLNLRHFHSVNSPSDFGG